MAGPNLTYHAPILPIMNRANTAPLTLANLEAATQSFKIGTPVQINNAGYMKAWDGSTHTAGIAGISESSGQNLTSAVAPYGGPAMPFGPVTGPGATQTYGYVINEPSAVNIALGTPISDGRTLYVAANTDNIFEAIFDNSNGTTSANYTPTQAMIGYATGQLGLNVDANGLWYVDAYLTSGNAVVQIIGINPLDGFIVNARVRFQFLVAAQQNV